MTLSKPQSEAAARHAHVANSKRRPRIVDQRRPIFNRDGEALSAEWWKRYSSDLSSFEDGLFVSIMVAH